MAVVEPGGCPFSDAAPFRKKDAASKAAALKYLGERGVLLVDPLPYSLQYSGKNVPHSNLRDKLGYRAATRQGWAHCLKLMRDSGTHLHPDCKVVFSLLKSARALLEEHGMALPLPDGVTFEGFDLGLHSSACARVVN